MVQVYLDEPFNGSSADRTLVALFATSKLLSTLESDRKMPTRVYHDVCDLVEAHYTLLLKTVYVYRVHVAFLCLLRILVIFIVAEYWLQLPGVLADF